MAPEPLAATDAAWLRMEDPTNLMMVTGVMVFERRLDPLKLRLVLEERLLSYRRFKQRVVEPPLGLGPPRWQLDRRLDLDAHLHRVALPEPGDKRALEAFVSDLMSTPLDFTKPLWQMHLVDYGPGSVLVARVHHCIADGIALIQVLLSLTDPTADLRRGERAAGGGRPASWDAAAAWLRAGASLAQAGFGLARDPAAAMQFAGLGVSAATTLARLTLMPADPRTPLKGKLGVVKRAAWSEPIPLAEVRAAARQAGATVNDVLVTAAAGALRSYLRRRGEDVRGLEIRAAVPVNLRPLDEAHRLGNRFSLVFLPLPLGIADPRRRLAAVKSRMDEIKGSLEPVVAFGVLNAIGLVPPQLQPLAVEFFGAKASAVMTNVPGPRERLYLAGRRLERVMFWVPQSGRMGLGLSILSYAGQTLIGVASDAGLVPEPQRIVDAFGTELGRLLGTPRAAGRRRAAAPATQPKPQSK